MRDSVRVMSVVPVTTIVASRSSSIFDGSTPVSDGSFIIKSDNYGNRNGYRLHRFSSRSEIRDCFSTWFDNFSFGFAGNDYYGITVARVLGCLSKKVRYV